MGTTMRADTAGEDEAAGAAVPSNTGPMDSAPGPSQPTTTGQALCQDSTAYVPAIRSQPNQMFGARQKGTVQAQVAQAAHLFDGASGNQAAHTGLPGSSQPAAAHKAGVTEGKADGDVGSIMEMAEAAGKLAAAALAAAAKQAREGVTPPDARATVMAVSLPPASSSAFSNLRAKDPYSHPTFLGPAPPTCMPPTAHAAADAGAHGATGAGAPWGHAPTLPCLSAHLPTTLSTSSHTHHHSSGMAFPAGNGISAKIRGRGRADKDVSTPPQGLPRQRRRGIDAPAAAAGVSGRLGSLSDSFHHHLSHHPHHSQDGVGAGAGSGVVGGSSGAGASGSSGAKTLVTVADTRPIPLRVLRKGTQVRADRWQLRLGRWCCWGVMETERGLLGCLSRSCGALWCLPSLAHLPTPCVCMCV